AGEATGAAVFDLDHALAAVRRVVRGAAEPGELVAGAQAVHFEEAVDIKEGQEDLLTRFLVEVSTPELFGAVTVDTCHRWVNVLSGVPIEETG
ncbi:hypothetical protein, partial [Streptomyces alkaliphilus]|uniref:hypothetical protein n=1 Tax=Streptomyces alkaliphilus TaxID=1472722 RepID=UPI001E474E68